MHGERSDQQNAAQYVFEDQLRVSSELGRVQTDVPYLVKITVQIQ